MIPRYMLFCLEQVLFKVQNIVKEYSHAHRQMYKQYEIPKLAKVPICFILRVA